MDTVWHTFWTYMLFRKKKWLPWALAGSMLPDVIMMVILGYNFFAYGFSWGTYGSPPFLPESIWNMSIFVHSLAVIIPLAIIAFFLYRPLVALFYGMGLHALLDYATHHTEAYAPFYPLLLWKFVSPFSYWETAHHSRLVMAINLTLFAIAFVYLWKAMKEIRWIEYGIFSFGILYLAFLSWFYFSNNRGTELLINGLIPLAGFCILLGRAYILQKSLKEH